jgi:hypothetical protein
VNDVSYFFKSSVPVVMAVLAVGAAIFGRTSSSHTVRNFSSDAPTDSEVAYTKHPALKIRLDFAFFTSPAKGARGENAKSTSRVRDASAN